MACNHTISGYTGQAECPGSVSSDKGRKQVTLWARCKIREFPVSWDAARSHLVFQRLRSAQTTTEGLRVSPTPCLLVTSPEQSVHVPPLY